MKPNAWKPIALCLALGLPGATLAQPAAEPVATHTDWSVFVAGNPQECYIVSPPTKSLAQRDGESVDVERGDIRLFVTFRPAESVTNEVSFSAGYPIRDGEPVELEVGSDSYSLSPGSGDANGWAWPASPAADSELVAAMRRGVNATVTGISSRGTTTIDTFSLLGFTAAVEDAEARCR